MNFKFDDLPKIYLEKNKYRISLVKDLELSWQPYCHRHVSLSYLKSLTLLMF